MAIPNSVCFAPWLRCNPLTRSHSRQAAVHHRISWTFILSIGEGPRDISAFAENMCCRQSRVVVPLDDGDRKLYLLDTLYGSTAPAAARYAASTRITTILAQKGFCFLRGSVDEAISMRALQIKFPRAEQAPLPGRQEQSS